MLFNHNEVQKANISFLQEPLKHMKNPKNNLKAQSTHYIYYLSIGRKIEYRSVTSQKNKFVKLWDLVPLSSQASLEKGSC